MLKKMKKITTQFTLLDLKNHDWSYRKLDYNLYLHDLNTQCGCCPVLYAFCLRFFVKEKPNVRILLWWKIAS